ncbi:MAG TPA: hypothetical protein PLK34_00200 [Candidatus Pacearchaeota archaeon]|nr:hypothetical protein [Candidatus Pacearchaeota archaeon]
MTEQNSPVHIRLDYGEAIFLRKDVLTSEIELILILKAINRYIELRKQETALKINFYKALKKLSASIKKMESTFPKLEIPKILKDSHKQKIIFETKVEPISEIKPKSKSSKTEDALEQQLLEIQKKIQSLSSD